MSTRLASGPAGARRCLLGVASLLALASARLEAAPGDTLFYDNLNGNLNDWTIVASGGDASIGNETSNQGRALRLRWGAVGIYTDPIDAAVPGAELSLWIRRGADSFSENPDDGEDLVVEYRNSSNAWTALETFPGGGTPGETLTPTYALPPDALHSNLSIRLRLVAGNGSDYDYWHVDDVRVTETAAPGAGFGVGSCEDFESGLGNWSIDATGGDAGLSGATYHSASSSLFTRAGAVAVTSVAIDLSAESAVDLTVWVRRGDDSFSEDPDNGEDLVLEYYASSGAWIALETFPGNGSPGEIFARSYALPANAMHAAFRLRFRQTGGNGGNNDYWHVDDVCLAASSPILFSFEEAGWTGGGGEVVDSSSSGLDGTAYGGATTAATTPAIATNPGTCRYGNFDGVDDYVEVPDDALLDRPNAVTVAAWINMRTAPSELHTIVSKDWNYEFHIDGSRRVYWWWNDSSGTVRSLTTAQSISLNQWHHVAITYESGKQTIYVDGAVWATASYAGTLRLNDLPLFIGTDYNFISRAFDGYIDEVYVLPSALSQAEVQALRDATHDCATAGAQFTINHDNFGIYCLPEAIAIDVIDSTAGTPLLDYNASVELDTQTGRGTWALVSGGGTLVDSIADDGVATYDWPLGESQAVFSLTYPEGPPTLDIDAFQVSDPGIRDSDAEGDLVFSASGFTLTAGPLGNPPPGVVVPFAATQTAAIPFDIYLTAYGQIPDDPVCGVIESYTGPRALSFWSDYADPVSGTVAVEIDGVAVAASEAAAVSQAVVFTNGQALVTSRYKDVGRIALGVKDETTIDADLPGGIRGGTAGFVVRPYDFVLSDIRDASGTVLNPAANDAAGPVFVAAGTPFRATVVALDADGDPTPNYGRETIPESVRLDSTLVAPLGGNNPAVSAGTGFASFVGGSATGLDFVWREVGIIDLRPAVGDADYLGSGDVVGGSLERVGRFVPDHFALGMNTPMLHTACGPGDFTYAGQPFDYLVAPIVTATAEDAGGATTVNYTGAFFKLDTTTLQNRIYSTTQGVLDLSGLPSAAVDPAVTGASGIATLTFSSGSGLEYSRSSIAAPFAAEIALSIDVVDADGVTASAPAIFGAAGGMLFDDGAEIRFGRLRFVNAVGSERVDLPVPLRAEYYAGPATGFVANTADECTSGVTLALGSFTEDLPPGGTCALDTGQPGASAIGCATPASPAQRFSAPPTAGDFRLTLAAPGIGKTGSVIVTGNVPDYLRFDWDAANPGDENPRGQATFGLYGGNARQIYLRELY